MIRTLLIWMSIVGISTLTVEALPLYGARSGRSCSNCHVNPERDYPGKGWKNPELQERKCSLSCSSCHTDPTGGGMRNPGGWYYARSTLGLVALEQRPAEDEAHDPDPVIRNWLGLKPLNERTDESEKPGKRNDRQHDQPKQDEEDSSVDPSREIGDTSGEEIKTSTLKSDDSADLLDPEEQKKIAEEYDALIPPGMSLGYQDVPVPADYAKIHRRAMKGPAWGKPFGKVPANALWDGRYGDLNADPLLALGFDGRLAYWSGGNQFFPMQAELHGLVHPIEHLFLVGSYGLAARKDTLIPKGQEGEIPLRFRKLYIMTAQWPYMSYARFGRMDNPFGLKIDDHTSPFRRELELDLAKEESSIEGLELGLAPNSPFGHLALYRNMTKDGVEERKDPGIGVTLNGGYRNPGWQVGSSIMYKSRELNSGGNLFAAGLYGAHNPFYYLRYLPITLLGEIDLATYQRPFSGSNARALLGYIEASYFIFNGFRTGLKYDYYEPDIEVIDDQENRYGFLLHIMPGPGVEWSFQLRARDPQIGETTSDVFISVHFFF